MKHCTKYISIIALSLTFLTSAIAQQTGEWQPLFNGKNLDGWQVGENAATFSVEDGSIKVAGKTAHLFYEGDVENHNFKNFEFKATVMTKPGANSGIYIHTQYQEGDGPLTATKYRSIIRRRIGNAPVACTVSSM